MPHVTAIALNGVGVKKARFVGFYVDFTRDDKATEAAIVRLQNGGGKTSMIAMLSGSFEPGKRYLDANGRTLSELFVGPKLGIVAVEVTIDEPGSRDLFGDSRRRIVGYAARFRTTDAGPTFDRVHFSFRKTDRASLRSLPIGLGDNRPAKIGEFTALLDELGAADPTCDVYHTTNQGEWRDFIENQVQIDLASSIHFMLKLNQQESGATTEILKRFDRDERFLDFLLEPIIGARDDRGLVENVKETLRSQSKLLENRALHAFLLKSIERLDAVRESQAEYIAAAARAEGAVSAYGKMAGCIQIRLEDLGSRRNEMLGQRQTLETKKGETDRALKAAGGLRKWLEHRSATMAYDAATTQRKKAAADRLAAEKALDQIRVEVQAVRLLEIQDSIAELDRAIAEEEKPLADAQARLRSIGGRAVKLLTPLVVQAESALAAVKDERKRLMAEHDRIVKAIADAEAQDKSHHRTLDRVQAATAKADAERAALVAEGHLKEGHDVVLAQSEAEAAVEAAAEAEAVAEGEATRTKDQLRGGEEGLRQAKASAEAGREKVAGARKLLETFQEARRALIEDCGKLRYFGGEDASPYDVELLSTLEGRRQNRQEKARALQDGADADQVTVDLIADSGLLPPTQDIETTIARLKEKSINAQWMPRYLLEIKKSPEEIRAALAEDPAKFSGVMVLGAGEQAVRSVADALSGDPGIRVPVFISSDTERSGRAASGVAVVTPSAATFDPTIATEVRENLEKKIEDDRQKAREMTQEAEELTKNINAVRAFVGRYPEGYESDREDEIRAAEDALQEAERLEAETEAAVADLLSTYDQARQRHESAEAAHRDARVRAEKLTLFVSRWQDRLAELEAERRNAEAEIEKLKQEIFDLGGAKGTNETSTEEADQAIERADADLRSVTARLDAIVERDDSVEPEAGDTAEGLEADYRTQKEVVDALDVGSDAKRERDAKGRQAADIKAGFARRFGSARALETAVGDLRKSRRRPQEHEIDSYVTRLRDLEQKVGSATAEERQAGDTLREIDAHTRGERIAPDDAERFDSMKVCDAEIATLTFRISRLEVDLDSVGGRLQDLDAKLATLDIDIQMCTAVFGEVEAFCKQRDIAIHPAAEAGEMSVEALRDEERRQRNEVDRLSRDLRDRKDAVMTRVRGYVDLLRDNEDLKKCQEIQASLTGWPPETIAERAEELVGEQRDLALGVAKRLEDAEEDMENCRRVIRGYFDRIFDRLKTVEPLSRVPEGMGAWSGKPFIKVQIEKTFLANYQEEVATLIRQWLEGQLKKQAKGEPVAASFVPLIKDIVTHVIGSRMSFQTLRPSTNWEREYNPVSELQKFSGGEKLLATLILFFVHMKVGMEARQRTMGSGMFLLLDNPIGEMNHAKLIRPALDMGRKMGIQLIGFTGINDMSVVGMFPVQVALRRKVTMSTTYTVVDEEANDGSHEHAKIQIKRKRSGDAAE